jgi:hypothetical protein
MKINNYKQHFILGKFAVQIATIEISINHLLDVRSPESVLSGEMIFVDLQEPGGRGSLKS